MVLMKHNNKKTYKTLHLFLSVLDNKVFLTSLDSKCIQWGNLNYPSIPNMIQIG